MMKTELKKYAAIAMAAVLTLALAACGGETASSEAATSEPVTSESASESVSASESMTSSSTSSKDAMASFSTVLDGIKNYESGTAGSSLKAVVAAAGLMDWAEDNDFTADDVKKAVTDYTENLSDEEKAAFAENAKEIVATAENLLTSSEAKDLFSEAGNPQTHETYSADKVGVAVNAINDAVTAISGSSSSSAAASGSTSSAAASSGASSSAASESASGSASSSTSSKKG